MNAIGTQLRDRLTRWRMEFLINKWTPPRNSGGIPGLSTRFSLSMEMNTLTRDGTAEPASRDQMLRHERGQGTRNFPCFQLITSRNGNLTRLIHTLAICVTIHIYIYTINTKLGQGAPKEHENIDHNSITTSIIDHQGGWVL